MPKKRRKIKFYKDSKNIIIMDYKTIVTTTIITIIAITVVGFALNTSFTTQMSGLNDKIDKLYDNSGLTKMVDDVSNSVVEILIPFYPSINSSQITADYVDSNGNAWSVGTGFVIRDDGYILTAKHVVENSKFAIAILRNGTPINVEGGVLFNDADLAIIKINQKLPSVELGDFDSAKVGSKVIFIGYPLFEPRQLTHEGIVSSTTILSNNVPAITINSIVNRGNSGSPVFLANSGKVVGIIIARENVANIPMQLIDVPKNISYETQLILEAQNKIYVNLIQAVKDNTQSGIGIAIPINKNLLSLLPPKTTP